MAFPIRRIWTRRRPHRWLVACGLNAAVGIALTIIDRVGPRMFLPPPFDDFWPVIYFSPLIVAGTTFSYSLLLHNARWWILGLAMTAPQYLLLVILHFVDGGVMDVADMLLTLLGIAGGALTAALIGPLCHHYLVNHRFVPGLCIHCGYRLRGLLLRRCPECGRIAPDEYDW